MNLIYRPITDQTATVMFNAKALDYLKPLGKHKYFIDDTQKKIISMLSLVPFIFNVYWEKNYFTMAFQNSKILKAK